MNFSFECPCCGVLVSGDMKKTKDSYGYVDNSSLDDVRGRITHYLSSSESMSFGLIVNRLRGLSHIFVETALDAMIADGEVSVGEEFHPRNRRLVKRYSLRI